MFDKACRGARGGGMLYRSVSFQLQAENERRLTPVTFWANTIDPGND
jgi:hypothetical protein